MKRTLLICLVILFMFSSIVSVNAESNTDSTLNVMYAYDVDADEITIIANFINIKAEEGIIGLEYDVKYDPAALELVKAEPIYPDSWDTLIGSGAIEDLSGSTDDGVFHWSFVVIALGRGIKKDNELGLRLEFKPIKRETTKVEFVYDDIISEVVENGMTLDLLHLSGSNATINIDFDNPEEPNIENSNVSIPEDSSVESSDVNSYESGDSSTDTDDDKLNDEVIKLPSIEVDITDADINPSDTVSDDENKNNWVTWVLIIIGIAVVTAIIFALVKSKKRK